MISTTYVVEGMTCGHCVAAVTEEISALPGVSAVVVDLLVGSDSMVTVTSAEPLADDEVRAALDDAGDYSLVGTGV